jgi:dTDP-4-dehydrorhamnose reductase
MTDPRNTVFVTGAGGQLGLEIREICQRFPHYRFQFFTHKELNIADRREVELKLAPAKDDIIINAAAYTAVDRAEDEPVEADKVNYLGPENLAKAAKKAGCLFVHVSTDYVFDGESSRPYKEGDPTGPRNTYGLTKLKGEQAILQTNARALIVRTSWLYSSFGRNFVKTMLDLGRKRGSVSVVFEQAGSPTYAADLAETVLDIMQRIPKDLALPQIYHYSNEGLISWYDFAKAIFETAKIDCLVSPIEIKDYPVRATRPVYSVMNKGKIKRDFHIEIPYWRDSLRRCLGKIQAGSQ